MNENKVECICGNKFDAQDIISFKFYERLTGPYFVYGKFKCPSCQMTKEFILKQDQRESDYHVACPIVLRMMYIEPDKAPVINSGHLTRE